MADTFTGKACPVSRTESARPFFLYFATHDIHVPRVPHPRFVGKTAMGPRGDAIVELDWSVGRILDTLDRLKLTRDTLVIFSSDNGPVVDDGYRDEAVEKLGDHKPAGPLRGGKYSAYDGGTRVPFVVRWPGTVKPGVSAAALEPGGPALQFCRPRRVQTARRCRARQLQPPARPAGQIQGGPAARRGTRHGALADRRRLESDPGRTTGRSATRPATRSVTIPQPQLFNLVNDIAEQNNVAGQYPDKVKEMLAMLAQIQKDGRSRPR